MASAAHGRIGALFCVGFLQSAAAQSGLFSEVATSLPANAYFPSASWADFDDDGDLDALLGGSLYRNDRSGTFSLVTSNLPAGDRNAVAWGDYDLDRDLDLVIAGNGVSRIYRNDGWNFVNMNVALAGLSQMAAAWGDCDNDGDLDLLLSGYMTNGGRSTILYRNDGNGVFISLGSMGLAGIDEGAMAWGDYDRDGDLDVLLSGGIGPSTFLTEVYRNNGNGSFTPANAGLRGVTASSAAWGDYDGDGHLDILAAGFYYGNYVLDLYRNQGDGTFTNINVGLQGIAYGSAKWADFDQDGDLDILLGGVIVNHGTAWITRLYRNNGNHIFSDTPTALPDTSGTSLDWGDYDGDGDLDILLTGMTRPTAVTRVYQNNSNTPNTPPQAPDGLMATVLADNEMLFQWNTPVDPQQTNGRGLSYQLRVGSTPGGSDLVSPHANEATAFRRLSERGPIATNSWRLRDVSKGLHYWSVQAIDAGLAGSAFAAEGIFEITNARPFIAGLSNVVVIPGQTAGPLSFTVGDEETPPGALLVSATSSNQTLVPNGNIILSGSGSARTVTIVPAPNQAGTAAVTVVVADVAQLSASNTFLVAVEQFTALSAVNSGYYGIEGVSMAWGDFDNDADLDLLLGNRQSPIQLLGNEGTNSFSVVLNLAFQYSGDHASAWGDFDHDGFLDFAYQNGWSGMAIHRNNRNRTFSEVPGLEFFRVGAGVSFDWGDYDNDGDLDLLVTGLTHQPPYGVLTRVLRNEGAGAGFSVLSGILPDVGSGRALWADFDNDGWLDVVMVGTTNVLVLRPTTGTNFAGIFRNNRLGGFEPAPVTLPPLAMAALAVADYDADGDIDFALSGFIDQATNRFCHVFRNEGGWSFSDLGQILPGLISGSLSWGDYDNDGRSDLAVTGTTSSSSSLGKTTRVFRYDGANGFIQTAGALPEFWSNAAEWGDFDGDGDLDLAAHGIAYPPARNPVLLRNNQPGSNQPPSTPTLLGVSVSGHDAYLSWTSATDAETPAAGLTYNLRVGTDPGGIQIVAPQSSSLGYRRIPKTGNAGPTTAKLLRNLRAGTYYWSVQAVDSGFAGSPFAAEGTFSVTNPLPPWFDLVSVVILKEDSPRQTNSLTGVTTGDAMNNFTLSFSNGSPALLNGVTLAYNPPLTTGQLQFQIVPNAWGTGAVTITASGVTTAGEALSFTRTLNVAVASVNDGPFAFSLVTNGVEDTPLAITLPAWDPDGDALTFTLLYPPPQWGTLTGGGTQLIYRPMTNYFGSDFFHFTVSDGMSNSLPGLVRINLAAVPDANGSQLALRPFTNGSYQVTLTGEPYVYYGFQASSNLTTWTELETLRASSNGIATWIDVAPPATAGQRFYRGRISP